MSVRVIAGEARGRRLAVPEVAGLRPTTDRARETLFNILMPRLDGCRFLDVFAGSGAVGIEALSRGAAWATFVECDRRALRCLRANLATCGLQDRAEVFAADWLAALTSLGRDRGAFDVAFFDAPYDQTAAPRYLVALGTAGLLSSGGLAVVEHRSNADIAAPQGWSLERAVKVGDSAFAFFSAAA